MVEDDGSLLFNELMGVEPPSSRGSPNPFPSTGAFEDDEEFIQFFSPELLRTPEPIIECRVVTAPIPRVASEEFAVLTNGEVSQATIRLAARLLQNGPYSFIDLPSFEGNGVYAIYYHGDTPLYGPLRSPGSTCPVYIGKGAQRESTQGILARNRFHTKTIQHTQLGVENFTFRFVCLPLNLIEFAEYNLIEAYRPIWNRIQGFGKRFGAGQPSDRPEQLVSRWDTLHSGRPTMSGRSRELQEVEDEVRAAIPSILDDYHTMMKLIADYESTNAQNQEDRSPGAPGLALDARREALGWGETSLPGHVRQRGDWDGDSAQQEAEALGGFSL